MEKENTCPIYVFKARLDLVSLPTIEAELEQLQSRDSITKCES